MRIVFIGAGALSVMTARMLLRKGHEVVLVEPDKARIEAAAEDLDCGFLHGDGSKPAILREADPEGTDFLFCLSDDDQTNILAGLVGRSLGFARVIPRIEDPEFEHICIELGLEDTIVPDRTIARHLAGMVRGQDPLELSAMLKNEARAFSFVVRAEDAGPLSELRLPRQARVICVYRGDRFLLPEEGGRIKEGDEVLLITHSSHLAELHQRWASPERTGSREE